MGQVQSDEPRGRAEPSAPLPLWLALVGLVLVTIVYSIGQPDTDARSRYERAWELSQAGQLRRALTECNKVIELQPNYADAYVLRGLVYAKEKEYEKAAADFDQAITLKPGYAEAYFNRASVRREQRQFWRALADVETGLQFKPDDAAAHYLKALAYDGLKQPAKALVAYNRFVELAPTNANETVEFARKRIAELEER